jgi:hypothetical protein
MGVTYEQYEMLPDAEKEHFLKCEACGEWFDLSKVEELIFHSTDHQDEDPDEDNRFVPSNRIQNFGF